MGSAKRMMMKQYDAHEIWIEICVRARVVKRCHTHEETYWATGADEREAYILGSILVRDGDALVAGFDRQTVLDGIKSAIADAGSDGCAHCAKHADD
ncbi:hypothetical protein WME99_32375 [Sorangium sp. So ce136]|uniref:hypothetical protein n=1 Tax=Sorangium sp. So ce136 TaxID=3133284 RepID=UPI003F1157F4